MSIDVRRWHREGLLRFSHALTWLGVPTEGIGVLVEADAVVLVFRSRRWGVGESGPESRSPREFSWKSSLDRTGVPTLAGNARDLSRWIMWDGAPVIKFKEHLDKPSHDARREATAGAIGTARRRSRSGRMASL